MIIALIAVLTLIVTILNVIIIIIIVSSLITSLIIIELPKKGYRRSPPGKHAALHQAPSALRCATSAPSSKASSQMAR